MSRVFHMIIKANQVRYTIHLRARISEEKIGSQPQKITLTYKGRKNRKITDFSREFSFLPLSFSRFQEENSVS